MPPLQCCPDQRNPDGPITRRPPKTDADESAGALPMAGRILRFPGSHHIKALGEGRHPGERARPARLMVATRSAPRAVEPKTSSIGPRSRVACSIIWGQSKRRSSSAMTGALRRLRCRWRHLDRVAGVVGIHTRPQMVRAPAGSDRDLFARGFATRCYNRGSSMTRRTAGQDLPAGRGRATSRPSCASHAADLWRSRPSPAAAGIGASQKPIWRLPAGDAAYDSEPIRAPDSMSGDEKKCLSTPLAGPASPAASLVSQT